MFDFVAINGVKETMRCSERVIDTGCVVHLSTVQWQDGRRLRQRRSETRTAVAALLRVYLYIPKTHSPSTSRVTLGVYY